MRERSGDYTLVFLPDKRYKLGRLHNRLGLQIKKGGVLMATNAELADAHFIIMRSRYNFKVISQNYGSTKETWSDYIVRIAKEIQRKEYRESI